MFFFFVVGLRAPPHRAQARQAVVPEQAQVRLPEAALPTSPSRPGGLGHPCKLGPRHPGELLLGAGRPLACLPARPPGRPPIIAVVDKGGCKSSRKFVRAGRLEPGHVSRGCGAPYLVDHKKKEAGVPAGRSLRRRTILTLDEGFVSTTGGGSRRRGRERILPRSRMTFSLVSVLFFFVEQASRDYLLVCAGSPAAVSRHLFSC